jgi:hypothetical protein
METGNMNKINEGLKMETDITNDDYSYFLRIDEDEEKMFMSLFGTFFSIAYDGGDGNALFICKNYKVDDVAELFYNNYLLGLQQFKKEYISGKFSRLILSV